MKMAYEGKDRCDEIFMENAESGYVCSYAEEMVKDFDSMNPSGSIIMLSMR